MHETAGESQKVKYCWSTSIADTETLNLTWWKRAHFPRANWAVLVRSRQSTQFTRTSPCCLRPNMSSLSYEINKSE
jgi:hypothetical protein